MSKIAFTDADIAGFCRATYDTNRIHNPEAMRSRGKLAIAPGMLILTYALNMASGFLTGTANSINAYFVKPVNSGDSLLFVTDGSFSELEVRLCVYNRSEECCPDVLYSKDDNNWSKIKRDGTQIRPVEGRVRSFPVAEKDINLFADIIRAGDDVRGFLYAIACSSRSLLEAVREPESELETEVNGLLQKGVLPVYVSLDIAMPNGFVPVKPAPLDFAAAVSGRLGKRGYACGVQCFQDGTEIYRAEYKLLALPERAVMSGIAKPLPK